MSNKKRKESPLKRQLSAVLSTTGAISSTVEEIIVQLPDYSVITVDVRSFTILLVRDFKQQLALAGARVSPSQMTLLYRSRVLGSVEIINQLHFGDKEKLQLIINTTHETLPLFSKYDEFIHSTIPKHNTKNIPTNVHFIINFQNNVTQQRVYLPALANCNALSTCYDGDMFGYFQGNLKEAANKGYRKWTEFETEQRVMLLEVDKRALESKLENLKYDVDGVNDGYYYGDKHSWQRYTHKMPIDCEIEFTPPHEIDSHQLQQLILKPLQPLTPGTYYAILLPNNVPTVPAVDHILRDDNINANSLYYPAMYPANLVDFSSSGVGEDKLLFFKTISIGSNDSITNDNGSVRSGFSSYQKFKQKSSVASKTPTFNSGNNSSHGHSSSSHRHTIHIV